MPVEQQAEVYASQHRSTELIDEIPFFEEAPMTIVIDERRMCDFARAAAQTVLDRLAEGLMDQPQDDLVHGTAQEIEKAIRGMVSPREIWNRAWDL